MLDTDQTVSKQEIYLKVEDLCDMGQCFVNKYLDLLNDNERIKITGDQIKKNGGW